MYFTAHLQADGINWASTMNQLYLVTLSGQYQVIEGNWSSITRYVYRSPNSSEGCVPLCIAIDSDIESIRC